MLYQSVRHRFLKVAVVANLVVLLALHQSPQVAPLAPEFVGSDLAKEAAAQSKVEVLL
jgi:hypothetical protein